jgi:hypothetical protein
MSAQKAWWVYAERSTKVYARIRRVLARSALAAAHLARGLDPKATGPRDRPAGRAGPGPSGEDASPRPENPSGGRAGKDRLLAFREAYLAERFRKRNERGWTPPRRLAVTGGGKVGDPLRIEAVPEPPAGEHGERDEG